MRAKAIVVLTICAGLAFCASKQVKIQKAREKDPKYQYNVGLFHLNQGNVDEAVKYFVKSLSLDTRYYLSWNALGLAHSMRGRLDEVGQGLPQVPGDQSAVHRGPQQPGDRLRPDGPARRGRERMEGRPARSGLPEPRAALHQPGPALHRPGPARRSLRQRPEGHPDPASPGHGLATSGDRSMRRGTTSPRPSPPTKPRSRSCRTTSCSTTTWAWPISSSTEYAKAKETFLKVQAKVTDAEMRDAISRYLRIIGDQR
ncbi:MAG: hypothetical protein M0C28_23755 [Candidatus Moduliflexus flocculans]|nr:hypothetical protein [Candidatus Moduliflexus flocculans]